MSDKNFPLTGFSSLAIHAGHENDPLSSHITPIYATSTFTFDTADQGMRRFAGQEPGYIYTRWGNPSFTEAVVDFAKGNPLLFRDKHDNAFYDTVSQLTGDRYRRNSRESVISHAQRCAILRHYAESNEWVRQAYFPNSRPPLFTPPKPEDYEALSGDTLELQKWELLGSLVFGLARRVLD